MRKYFLFFFFFLDSSFQISISIGSFIISHFVPAVLIQFKNIKKKWVLFHLLFYLFKWNFFVFAQQVKPSGVAHPSLSEKLFVLFFLPSSSFHFTTSVNAKQTHAEVERRRVIIFKRRRRKKKKETFRQTRVVLSHYDDRYPIAFF